MKIKKQRDAKEGRKKDKEQNTKIRAKKLNKMMKKKKDNNSGKMLHLDRIVHIPLVGSSPLQMA